MDIKRIFYLYQRYTSKSLSPGELHELKQILSSDEADKSVLQFIDNEWAQLKDEELIDIPQNSMQSVFDHIVSQPQTYKKPTRIWPRIAAAAILILAVCGYQYLKVSSKNNTSLLVKNDISPGKNAATLILANGQKIFLHSAKAGQIAKQAGVAITKTDNGQIVYTSANNITAGVAQLNTLSTAKGETYQVTLPDGTRIWLNAASSITYPARFSGAARTVNLNGEGYFEVAKDKTHPFKVVTDQQEVTVLGTHFNINAYDDENAVTTTLLEGSVKVVSNNGNQVMIKPGEQTVLKANDIKIADANTETAVAWKNGDFIFKNEDFKTVMRKISRWYDVDVVYDSSAPINHIPGGWISRSKSISSVLKIMELTGKVHFKVEGRRITVGK